MYPKDHPLHNSPYYKALMHYRALKNLRVITSPYVAMSGGMDFSEKGVTFRYQSGYNAARCFLEEGNLE